jgi:hypothetical protein
LGSWDTHTLEAQKSDLSFDHQLVSASTLMPACVHTPAGSAARAASLEVMCAPKYTNACGLCLFSSTDAWNGMAY